MFEFVFDRRRVSSGSGARPVGSPVNWIRSLVIEISLPSTANRDTSRPSAAFRLGCAVSVDGRRGLSLSRCVVAFRLPYRDRLVDLPRPERSTPRRRSCPGCRRDLQRLGDLRAGRDCGRNLVPGASGRLCPFEAGSSFGRHLGRPGATRQHRPRTPLVSRAALH